MKICRFCAIIATTTNPYGNFNCSGNPAEEQLWTEFRGVVQERVHDGTAQAWREALLRAQGGRD